MSTADPPISCFSVTTWEKRSVRDFGKCMNKLIKGKRGSDERRASPRSAQQWQLFNQAQHDGKDKVSRSGEFTPSEKTPACRSLEVWLCGATINAALLSSLSWVLQF